MAKDLMGYNRLVERSLRNVVREALARVSNEGLPGAHHFYVSFRTTDPGVQIPDFLRAKFPEEMTIVLQHQFWGLTVEADSFEVTLSFSRARQRMHVPFRALTGFFDPSVQFGLQFQPLGETHEAHGVTLEARPAAPAGVLAPAKPGLPAEPPGVGEQGDGRDGASNKVVTLDRFRKK